MFLYILHFPVTKHCMKKKCMESCFQHLQKFTKKLTLHFGGTGKERALKISKMARISKEIGT